MTVDYELVVTVRADADPDALMPLVGGMLRAAADDTHVTSVEAASIAQVDGTMGDSEQVLSVALVTL